MKEAIYQFQSPSFEKQEKRLLSEFLDVKKRNFIVATDGTNGPFCSSQDHKALEDNDKGPNTGGMNATPLSDSG